MSFFIQFLIPIMKLTHRTAKADLLLSPRSSKRLSSTEISELAPPWLPGLVRFGIGEYEKGLPTEDDGDVSASLWLTPFEAAGASNVELSPAVDCKSANKASGKKKNYQSDQISFL